MIQHIYQDSCFEENWFNYENVYKTLVNNSRPDGSIVEVGAWKGRSSAFLVVEAKNKSKDLQVHIIDTWLGSQEHTQEMKIGLYEKFVSNMAPLGGLYSAHRMTSLEGSGLFKDGSLDGVFLDADHTYEAVKADILAWLPKLRSGGILAGHDYISTFPGVIRAVNEIIPTISTYGQCWLKVC
jgi:Methyltransferase domain